MTGPVLGISARYHDAAAALVHEGRVLGAASEERFSRLKHDASMPVLAARALLDAAGLKPGDLEAVVYYEKPLRKYERIVVHQALGFPRTLRSFLRGQASWLTDKLWVRNQIVEAFGVAPKKVLFSEHHLSHAAAAFYGAGVERAAVLVADGVGEWSTTSLYTGGPEGMVRLAEVRFPHSLGLVYSAFTAYLGFRVNEGEYKVMGLAAYGEPKHEAAVRKVLRLSDDGGFDVDLDYVTWHISPTDSYGPRFVDLFGPARRPDSPLDPFTPEGRHWADIAASVQKVLEDAMVGLANHLHARTGLPDLCLAGGVALNCVANHAVLARSPFERLHVHPAPGDSGGALGAAWWASHEVLGGPKPVAPTGADLGIAWPSEAIASLLTDLRVPFTEVGDDRATACAADLADGKVVGWFQGRFEWGPRALGQRSILADPGTVAMRDHVNDRIKLREPFRPFAPAVLREDAERYFVVPGGAEQPLNQMLMVLPTTPEGAATLPATTHADGSARVQLLRPTDTLAPVVRASKAGGGTPAVLNTSFNLRGEPMVASPLDALATFDRCDMDVVYLEGLRVVRRTP